MQPPAIEAPIPMKIPPHTALTAVLASGALSRNSPEPFAAMNEPGMMPRTNHTPQSAKDESPVARKETTFADGVVIPSPALRPVAAESG